MNPYQNLANAIVELAAKDYRTVLRRCKKYPHDADYARERLSLEQFFQSGWFGILTDLDGEVLMEKIKLEVVA